MGGGNDFRKAELIELHDAGVAVHPVEYSDALAGWREFIEDTGYYVLDGRSVATLAEALGWKTHPVTGINTQTGSKESATIEDLEFPILRRRRERIGDNTTSLPDEESNVILELWAKIEAPHVLAIRLVIERDEEEDGPTEYVQEVSYCGRFTVWWETEQNGAEENGEEEDAGEEEGA
jgi:hypothetical protein